MIEGRLAGAEGREDAELADAKAENSGPALRRGNGCAPISRRPSAGAPGRLPSGRAGRCSRAWGSSWAGWAGTSPIERRDRMGDGCREIHALRLHSGTLSHSRDSARCQHREDAQIDGAVPRAVAAAGAEQRAELLRIDAELVVDPLPLPLRSARFAGCGPRRAAVNMAELAGVPVPHPRARPPRAFVDDVETMAGRAGVSAGPAAETPPGQRRPLRVFKAACQKLAHRRQIEVAAPGLRHRPRPCRPTLAVVRPANSGRPFSVKQRTSQRAVAQVDRAWRRTPRVSAGPEPTDVQKQWASCSGRPG